MAHTDKEQLEGLYWALRTCEYEEQAKEVKAAYATPKEHMVKLLTRLEQEIPAGDAWVAVVRCKAVLTGRGTDAQYTEILHKIGGMM